MQLTLTGNKRFLIYFKINSKKESIIRKCCYGNKISNKILNTKTCRLGYTNYERIVTTIEKSMKNYVKIILNFGHFLHVESRLLTSIFLGREKSSGNGNSLNINACGTFTETNFFRKRKSMLKFAKF